MNSLIQKDTNWKSVFPKSELDQNQNVEMLKNLSKTYEGWKH